MEFSCGPNDEKHSAASGKADRTSGEQRSVTSAPSGGKRDEIFAQTIREQCLAGQMDGQELSFVHKRVMGQLDLAGVLIAGFLRFGDCEFTDSINLTGARAVAGIHISECEIQSLYADLLSVQGDFVLEHTRSSGLVSLCGARLTGHLRCSRSKFLDSAGPAFNGKGMIVDGSALFDGGFCAEGEFILGSARIEGSVDMTGACLTNKAGAALMAERIRVGTGLFLGEGFKAEGAVLLAQARISGALLCGGGQFIASPGPQVSIDAHLVEADEVCLDQDFKATGLVRLDGSTVTGTLTCNGGTFCDRKIALQAQGIECRNMFLADGFVAAGEVQLIGASISRELNCTKGKFKKDNGAALNADGLICDGRVFLNKGFEAFGEILLRNARIKTELNCSNGKFRYKLTALNAGGLACDGNVYLNETFQAAGRVELVDARIGRELNCAHGEFRKLHAQRLTVGAKFDWQPRSTPEEVDVSFADVGLLLDKPLSWPPGKTEKGEERTKLEGFTFGNLDTKAEVRQRICWLNNASYAPDVYQQLSRIYRQKGMSSEAKDIAIERERDRRRRGGLPRASIAWSRFLDFTVRYGYAMYRPLVAVLAFGIVGIVLFFLAKSHHLMEPVAASQSTGIDAGKCTTSYPCFAPYTYAFEILFPVINLRQVNFWLPSMATLWGVLLMAWVWLAIAFGWVVSVAVAAGIGHLFSQRD